MIRLRFGSKPGARAVVELTHEEARRLRDRLTSALDDEPAPTIEISDVGRAAMAVEEARRKGKQ